LIADFRYITYIFLYIVIV